MNQQSGTDIETFYNKGNYQNYAQKFNYQNRQNYQTFNPRTPVSYNRQQQTKTRCNKNLSDRNGAQLQYYICQSIYHIGQQCPELYQSDFDHLTN